MTMLKRILKRLIPWEDARLYRVAQSYVDAYHNNNNSNMETNGELHLIETFAPGVAVAFDVGANIGEWAKLFLDVNQAANIHCFEPSRTTFDQLQQNVVSHQAILNNIGLSSSDGQAELYVLHDASGINSLYDRQWHADGRPSSHAGNSEIVQLRTLDGYCEQHSIDQIDLLKIDVEGHELDVLRGAANKLEAQAIQYITFEYDRSYIDARVLLKDMFDLLQSYGYHLYKTKRKGLSYYPVYDQTLENFRYQNWFAARIALPKEYLA